MGSVVRLEGALCVARISWQSRIDDTVAPYPGCPRVECAGLLAGVKEYESCLRYSSTLIDVRNGSIDVRNSFFLNDLQCSLVQYSTQVAQVLLARTLVYKLLF